MYLYKRIAPDLFATATGKIQSVTIMVWTSAHRAFAVETFLKTNESVVATQRAFRAHFKLGQNDSIPDRKSILLWVENFRTTGSLNKRKPPGRPRSVRTPENVQTVRESVVKSPTRSARKHASVLGLSDRTVRRILHNDLKFELKSDTNTTKNESSGDGKLLQKSSTAVQGE